MADKFTKWTIHGCFKTEEGDEIIDTVHFWSKIATDKTEVLNRYEPVEYTEILEAYTITSNDVTINTAPKDTSDPDTEDIQEDTDKIIHA